MDRPVKLKVTPSVNYYISCRLNFLTSMASDAKVIPSESKLQLYSYFRSSCAWRVRIALNLKELKYEYKAVNVLKGEQFSPEFAKLNPLNLVPALVDGDIVITDSLAIIMYLEEKHPQHPLLPQDLHRKAINFKAANIVCSSIQPFQNISVLNYIEQKINSDEKLVWAQYHITKGFAALEKLLKPFSGRYATGDDVFLVLQPFAFGIGWYKAAQHDSNSSHLGWIGAQFLGLWAGLGFYRLSGCLGHVLGKSPTRSLFRLLYADLNVRPDSKQDGLGQALPGLVHVAAYLVAFC